MLMGVMLLFSSCMPINKFIKKNNVTIISRNKMTMKKEFVVYIKENLEQEIALKFPSIKEKFKDYEFDIVMKFLITSNSRKDILWFDYEIVDYLENIEEEGSNYCDEICYYVYSIIQPKFYPTLLFNRPHRSNNIHRKHKLPVQVSISLEVTNGEWKLLY
ncbi:hypothetical protein AsAng_0005250 [Aureispira anguillae]|uniref:Uncharacterized protein n=2 Tax=Aureispira anguillae TaxID=2864201 RepID=A0A916DQ07_9BACT|nr:hypothetical protein AsAng_0005250 [Aureispira anguillae]